MKPNRKFLQTLAAITATSPLALHAVTWDGGGVSNTSGNWSVGANWNPDTAGGPATGGGLGDLIDVTTGTRTVTYDSAATGAVSSLAFNQTSPGAVNELLILKNFAVTNAYTLGAAAGTERITVSSTAAASYSLTSTGGLTIDAGGELVLTATGNGTNGFNLGTIAGSATSTNLSGGLLRIAPTTGTSSGTSVQSDVNGTFTMTSGSLVIDNSTGLPDRRVQFPGNTSITGGTVSSSLAGVNGSVFLGGATNVFSPTTFDLDLGLTLSGTTQALDTSVTLGSLTLRGGGASLIKTVTSTAVGNGIGQIAFLNSANNGNTTLKLGSNLTLNAGAALPTAGAFGGQGGSSAGTVNFGIDTDAGFIFDLSSNAGTFTPNKAINTTAITTNYHFSGTGRIKARSFNLNVASQVNLGAGSTLEANGGNSTVNTLSGGGGIDATSTFLYSGNAVTATPATLASSRSLGIVTVASGALRLSGTAVTAAGLLTIGSGATFDPSISGMTANGLTVTNGNLFSPTALTIVGTGANVFKSGNSTLTLGSTVNSYTGTTTVQDGRLNFAGDAPLSSDSVLGNSATAILLGTASSTTSQRIQLYGTVDGSTFSRAIDATGGTSVATDPASSNRYRIGADIASGGTITYNGNVVWGSVGALAIGRTLELGAVQLDTTSVFTGLFSTTTGSGGNLLINGGASGLGFVSLTNTGNTFTNGLTVTQGTLLVDGNAPAGGVSVLGNNSGAIGLGDGGTPANNWTISGGALNSGDAGNPAILTDGAFTVARAVNLSNVAAFTGGPAPTTAGNGSPNSYIIGGNAAANSTFSGNVTVAANTSDKLLRLSQVSGGTVTLSGVINPNTDATKVLDVAKIGAGKVILTGSNTYDGDTTVTEGILEIGVASNFANASDIRLTTGSTLALTVVSTDTVNALFIDGTQQASGKWGRTGSIAALGADNETALITGDGLLQVTTGSVGATYASYIAGFPGAAGTPGFTQDADNDSIANGVENVLGTNPTTSSAGLVQISATTTSVTFRHSLTNTPASDVSYSYEWSSDLTSWFPSGGTNGSGTTATIASTTLVDNIAPANDEIQVTITITSGPASKLFGRIKTNKL